MRYTFLKEMAESLHQNNIPVLYTLVLLTNQRTGIMHYITDPLKQGKEAHSVGTASLDSASVCPAVASAAAVTVTVLSD